MTSKTMQGVNVTSNPPERVFDLKTGEYWLVKDRGADRKPGIVPGDNLWFRLPNGELGHIMGQLPAGSQEIEREQRARWSISENADGTITASPSIWMNPGRSNPTSPEWHGFLTDGVWTEC